MRFLKFIFRIS